MRGNPLCKKPSYRKLVIPMSQTLGNMSITFLIIVAELDAKPIYAIEKQTLQNLAKRKQQMETQEQNAQREFLWQTERLLWLAYTKNNPSTCYLARIPHSVLFRIIEHFRKVQPLPKKTPTNNNNASKVTASKPHSVIKGKK